jgi:hypothetical protein
MRVFVAVAVGLSLCTSLCASAGLAQISVQGENGSNVTIGPGGITINDPNSGSRAKVKMGPGGIQVNSANGGNRSTVNLGSGINVRTNKNNRVTTVTQNAGSAEQQVSIIEKKIYGKTFAGTPLMARVEKLEVDNLGKKGSGPLKVRISILARELGVNLAGSESAHVTINEGSSGGSISAKELKDLVINENNQTVNGHCNGNDIVLNGNHCQLHLSGKLGSITINGNHNVVKSERIEEVVTNGNSNTVTWSSRHETPDISNSGKDNIMRPQ